MDAVAPEYGLGRTTFAAECRSNLAEATGWVWALVLLGVLVLLASAMIMVVLRSAQGNRATAVSALPTAASQIEHLARLRDQGLLKSSNGRSRTYFEVLSHKTSVAGHYASAATSCRHNSQLDPVLSNSCSNLEIDRWNQPR